MRVFDFGENWKKFSDQRLDCKKLDAARASLKSLLKLESLHGISFLDVGCGSGLFSIAAYQLGAIPVMGLDINSECIRVSRQNQEKFVQGAPITFLEASILDDDALSLLEQYDVVYAWGSLHHTGAMWDAISKTMSKVKPGGVLTLAIYNRHLTSPIWKIIKRTYNQMPCWGKRIMSLIFGAIIFVAKLIVTRRNPFSKERGMDFWYDVIDWIGGYPYEYAKPQEVIVFGQSKGFNIANFIPSGVPTGCNEFVFKRIS